MKGFIKNLLREGLINEVRVLNSKISSLENEQPLKDSDTIRVYHGFNNYKDAIKAIKFGFSGKEKATRITSYESNNNPNGLFVTLDLDTAKKFTYPSGEKGIIIILELNVKVSDLEAPVWPNGSYTVQGQFSGNWKDSNDRHENGTLKAREDARDSKYEFVRGSDRPELAASLMDYERQALFVGDINSNMIKSVWYGESGKFGYSPKSINRMSPKELLSKFNPEEIPNKSKFMFFNPNDNFEISVLDNYVKNNPSNYLKDGNELLNKIIRNPNNLHLFFYPKQINQMRELGLID
jgi:hypothetical protein